MRIHRQVAVGLALTLTAVTASLVTPSTASALKGRDRATLTYTPAIPTSPPSQPPLVTPTACVRSVGHGAKEAVFGFVSRASVTSDALGEPDHLLNEIVVDGKVLLPREGGQVTQLRPGRHTTEFSVRYTGRQPPTWRVWVPSDNDDPVDTGWIASLTPAHNDGCDKRVPAHFAVVTTAPFFLSTDNLVTVEDPASGFPLRLLSYDQTVGYGTVTSCSAGGRPLVPDIVYGWVADLEGQFVPLDDVIREEIRAETPYLLSRQLRRTVVTPAAVVHVNLPTADITGRCAFGRKVVESTTYWRDDPVAFQTIPTNIDSEGNAYCTVTDAGEPLCLTAEGQAPGGSRFR